MSNANDRVPGSTEGEAFYAAAAVDVISKKWHPAIVQLLLEEESLGFSDLKGRMDGISGKVLSTSLDDLEEKELVDRRVVNESPLRVEYRLTERGAALEDAIRALAAWGEEYFTEETEPKLLIVDDDRRIAQMHATWLSASYDVDTAHNAKQALKRLDEDVELVLLDRRMPGRSGDELLRQIRAHDIDCHVVLVTSTDPNFDIIDLPFDEYVVKPSTKQEIVGVVDRLLEEDLSADQQEYRALRAKQSILSAEKPDEDLESNDRYQWLLARMAELRDELETVPEADA